MLEIQDVTKNFGGVCALSSVSFRVEKGSFVGLIGPNGSGKTTLFNVISGAYRPSLGQVLLDGQEIGGLPPDQVCARGIARTFQIPQPIQSLTIEENVMLGAAFGSRGNKEAYDEERCRQLARHYLEFVGLEVNPRRHPDKLTAGDLRKIELARALATQPQLLLADEVMSGLNREELKEAAEILSRIRQELGITIIWVEHIMHVLMKLVERVVVLNYGVLLADDDPAAICNDAEVCRAYLGQG